MTTKVQRAVELLTRRAEVGVTWRELSVAGDVPMGHGSASRVLSDLHRTGAAVRLVERRDRCSVYVLPECAGDRPTVPHGTPAAPPPHSEDAAVMAARVEGVIERWGLDTSASPAMNGLAADLRAAVGRAHADDAPTLALL
jgi:hypothetical protein